MNRFVFIFCFLVFNSVQAFQTSIQWTTKSQNVRLPSIGRLSPVQSSDEDMTEGSPVKTSTEDFDASKTTAESLGFDAPTSSSMSVQSVSENLQGDRLRKSLDDSAKFKIRNDARFTWLSTLLVSGAYTYGCLAPDGQEFLDILGIPNGGIVGGIGGIAFSLASIFLFFAPELFAAKRK